MTLKSRAWHARERMREARRTRQLVAATLRDSVPPPPSSFAAFGRDSVVVPPARVTRADCIEIGDGVVVLEHAWLSVVAAVEGITPRLKIGDGCRIGRFASIACVGEVTFGPKVLTADRIFIGDTYHRYDDPTVPVLEQPMAQPARVTIGGGAFLGIGCAVLHGVSIGEGAYVGAGAVVTEDVPPHTAVAGNPARRIKHWDADAAAWLRDV